MMDNEEVRKCLGTATLRPDYGIFVPSKEQFSVCNDTCSAAISTIFFLRATPII